jgi:hypothetical protein
VDRASENLLARPALTGEKHGRLELGSAFQELEDLDHGRRCRHDGPLSDRAVDVPLKKRICTAQALPLSGLADGQEHLRGLERLGQIVVGAAFHRLDGEISGPIGRHHDHGRPREPPSDLGQELHSVHTGHSKITEHHVHRAGLDLPQRGLCMPGAGDVVALGREHELEALPKALVVVHDQDSFAHRRLIGERGTGVRFAECSRTARG